MSEKQLRVLRGLTNTTLISLLLAAVLMVIGELFSTFYSVLVGAGIVLVTLYCYRRADQAVGASREYYLWRYVPTLIFVIGPLLWLVMSAADGEWSASAWLLLVRFVVSFIVPIGCLIAMERMLRQALLRIKTA